MESQCSFAKTNRSWISEVEEKRLNRTSEGFFSLRYHLLINLHYHCILLLYLTDRKWVYTTKKMTMVPCLVLSLLFFCFLFCTLSLVLSRLCQRGKANNEDRKTNGESARRVLRSWSKQHQFSTKGTSSQDFIPTSREPHLSQWLCFNISTIEPSRCPCPCPCPCPRPCPCPCPCVHLSHPPPHLFLFHSELLNFWFYCNRCFLCLPSLYLCPASVSVWLLLSVCLSVSLSLPAYM